jgi:hypothetical protein
MHSEQQMEMSSGSWLPSLLTLANASRVTAVAKFYSRNAFCQGYILHLKDQHGAPRVLMSYFFLLRLWQHWGSKQKKK